VFYDAAGDVLLLADDTALTLSKTAITGSAAVAAAASDYVLISDTSDSGELKKALVSSIGGGGGGDMLAATYDPQTIADDAFDRANHTGSQVASTVSDFGTAVASNSVVTGNTSSIAANALTIFNLGSDVAAHHSRLAGIDAVQTTQNADIGTNTTKLAGIEAGADVTDSANVEAAVAGVGTDSVVIGPLASSDGARSSAFGYSASADGDYSSAVGRFASTAGDYSSAVGPSASAAGIASSAFGYSTSAAGDYSVAVGRLASAGGAQSTAVGRDASAAGTDGSAFGREASAGGAYSTALGRYSSAGGSFSAAIGSLASAAGTESVAIGRYASATASGSVAIGKSVTAATVDTTSVNNLEVQGDLVVLGNRNGGPILATATIDTSNNLNDGTTARRSITAGSLGTDWSIATNALTYSGTPSAVHIEVNVSYTSTGVRAAPVVELWKGTTKLAMAHTGYIRNNSGHNEASANFTFIDTAPGTNPAYHLESSRGSTITAAATPLTPSQFSAYVFT
tara:strand:+ start:2421 stop:3956 length:1536 start_codon:yes stop_codon:yes gene_type:complete